MPPRRKPMPPPSKDAVKGLRMFRTVVPTDFCDEFTGEECEGTQCSACRAIRAGEEWLTKFIRHHNNGRV